MVNDRLTKAALSIALSIIPQFWAMLKASRPAPLSKALLGETAMPSAPGPRAGGVRFEASLIGDSGSAEALARLNAAITELRAAAVQPLLERAVAAIHRDEPQEAAELALKALEKDERNGLAWYVLAIAREKSGDFKTSIHCYETALQLIPDHSEIANDLGRLAYRLDMKDVAEQLFAHYLARNPGSPEASNNLACAWRDQNRYQDAVEVLRASILANPTVAILWNTLGTVLSEQGDPEASLTFYDEALRLDPSLAKARYNRANAKLALGDTVGALKDCEDAIPHVKAPDEICMMKLAHSTMLLCQSRLGEGWDAYEVRLDPQHADVTHFMIDRPQWTPDADLT
ncbi:MAG: tetratricopeptide repeat protein, partial [Caulobacteraceae bacterium]